MQATRAACARAACKQICQSSSLRRGVHNAARAIAPPAVEVYTNSQAAVKSTFENYKPSENTNLPLFVNDCGVVERQYNRWVANLPRVRPFYAVKCNPATEVLQQLASSGSGFDCATSAEIKQALDLGVNPEDIIFANPVKTFSDIEFARAKGVKKMTFDNLDELRKVHQLFPEAELVLRLLPDDSGSIMRFGSKFGACVSQCDELLDASKELGLQIIGVSFHIGSGCFDPLKYESAIKLSRSVFDLAKSKDLPAFTLLDIGGGFPGDPTPHATGRDGVPAFEKFAEVIEESVDRHFPAADYPALSVISEPGRYFATAAGTLFTMVQGKRKNPQGADADYLYYINDGVYGSFNSIIFDYAKPIPCPVDQFFAPERVEASQRLKQPPSPRDTEQPLYTQLQHGLTTRAEPVLARSTIFGPTCDSIDKVVEDIPMRELHLGEWLVFDHMGAYTTAAASTFNGVPKPIMTHVRSLQ